MKLVGILKKICIFLDLILLQPQAAKQLFSLCRKYSNSNISCYYRLLTSQHHYRNCQRCFQSLTLYKAVPFVDKKCGSVSAKEKLPSSAATAHSSLYINSYKNKGLHVMSFFLPSLYFDCSPHLFFVSKHLLYSFFLNDISLR